jgi:uncharacterized membrane protein
MNGLQGTGRFFFALAMVVFGIQSFVYNGFLAGLEVVPEWALAHTFWAYYAGVVLIAGGVAIALRNNIPAAALLTTLFALSLVLLHGPRVPSMLHDLVERTRAFETLAVLGAAMVLTGSLVFEDTALQGWNTAAGYAVEAGRWLFAVSLAIFGLDHFQAAPFVATLIWAWIPWHLFWAYFTGTCFVAAAVCIITRQFARPAVTLLGVMFFLWFVILHLPRVAAHLHSGDEWNSAFVVLAMSGSAFFTAGTLRRPETKVMPGNSFVVELES